MTAWAGGARAGRVFGKTLREVLRDPLTLALTLVFAPAFVLLYYAVFPEMAPAYELVVVNQDRPVDTADGEELAAGRDLQAALAAVRDASDLPLLRVSSARDREQAEGRIRHHQAAAILVIPEGFSRSVAELAANPSTAPPASYTLAGDRTQPAYLLTAVLADATAQAYVQQATGVAGPVRVQEESVTGAGSRTDFEIYVPGLIVFSVILLVFLAAMTATREVESGAMRRLRLTRMTATEYVLGTSGVLGLVGIAGVLITFGTAWLCGFRSEGPLWVALLVLSLTTLSVIGVGMMVAAVSRTVARAFVIANFPLGLLMFFSGSIMPMPRITWVTVAGHPLGPFELMAPTHAVTALNRVLTDGVGFSAVGFELIALTVLTGLYFAGGVALLHRHPNA